MNDLKTIQSLMTSPWADKILASLSPDERIAQLIHVASWSNKGPDHEAEIIDLIRNHGIGGVCFFQGDPESQARITNAFQESSKVPLFISIDGEWGLAMRLDNTISFPFQMALGAVQDDSLIYEMGAEIACQCRRIGIHINYAPVVDINTNADNPVIGFRAFGEDKNLVTRKALAYMRGMQENGVIAVAKHFPGHGDTAVDSHFATPVIPHNRQRLEEQELFPFRELIAEGVVGVMVSHLRVPALDPNEIATVSKPIISDLLKNEMEFEGLIFTDALNMKGISDHLAPGEVDARALIAGNDILLYTEDVNAAIKAIRAAVERGDISQEEIDQRCRKQLAAKAWAGLDQFEPIELNGIPNDLHSSVAISLYKKLVAASMTDLLPNSIPIAPLKTATLTVYANSLSAFHQYLDDHRIFDHYTLPKDFSNLEADKMLLKLSAYDQVVLCIRGLNKKALNRFDISDAFIRLVKKLTDQQDVYCIFLANPYALNIFAGLNRCKRIILGFEDSVETQIQSAKAILGQEKPTGKLPVSIPHFS